MTKKKNQPPLKRSYKPECEPERKPEHKPRRNAYKIAAVCVAVVAIAIGGYYLHKYLAREACIKPMQAAHQIGFEKGYKDADQNAVETLTDVIMICRVSKERNVPCIDILVAWTERNKS